VYFELSDSLITFLPKTCVKSTQDPITKGNNTKLTYTKQRVQRSKSSEPLNSTMTSFEDILNKKMNNPEEFK
jgi:hypothetical protein